MRDRAGGHRSPRARPGPRPTGRTPPRRPRASTRSRLNLWLKTSRPAIGGFGSSSIAGRGRNRARSSTPTAASACCSAKSWAWAPAGGWTGGPRSGCSSPSGSTSTTGRRRPTEMWTPRVALPLGARPGADRLPLSAWWRVGRCPDPVGGSVRRRTFGRLSMPGWRNLGRECRCEGGGDDGAKEIGPDSLRFSSPAPTSFVMASRWERSTVTRREKPECPLNTHPWCA